MVTLGLAEIIAAINDGVAVDDSEDDDRLG